MKKIRNLKGFTMVEMLIAVTIMGILTSMMVVQYGDYVTKSEETAIKHELQQIISVIDTAIATGKARIGDNNESIVSSYYDFTAASDIENVYKAETGTDILGTLSLYKDDMILSFERNERTAYFDLKIRSFVSDYNPGGTEN